MFLKLGFLGLIQDDEEAIMYMTDVDTDSYYALHFTGKIESAVPEYAEYTNVEIFEIDAIPDIEFTHELNPFIEIDKFSYLEINELSILSVSSEYLEVAIDVFRLKNLNEIDY